MIVLNKCDLIDDEKQHQIRERITALNKMAKILPAEMANVPIPKVLDIGGFDLDRALSINDAFLEPEYPFEWAGVYSLPAGKKRFVFRDGTRSRNVAHLLPSSK